MEEPPLLLAMHGIVGRIEIKDDLVRRSLVRLQEQLDQQPLDGRRNVADLVIARQLQPVQRRRCAILAARVSREGVKEGLETGHIQVPRTSRCIRE